MLLFVRRLLLQRQRCWLQSSACSSRTASTICMHPWQPSTPAPAPAAVCEAAGLFQSSTRRRAWAKQQSHHHLACSRASWCSTAVQPSAALCAAAATSTHPALAAAPAAHPAATPAGAAVRRTRQRHWPNRAAPVQWLQGEEARCPAMQLVQRAQQPRGVLLRQVAAVHQCLAAAGGRRQPGHKQQQQEEVRVNGWTHGTHTCLLLCCCCGCLMLQCCRHCVSACDHGQL